MEKVPEEPIEAFTMTGGTEKDRNELLYKIATQIYENRSVAWVCFSIPKDGGPSLAVCGGDPLRAEPGLRKIMDALQKNILGQLKSIPDGLIASIARDLVRLVPNALSDGKEKFIAELSQRFPGLEHFYERVFDAAQKMKEEEAHT